MNKLNLTTLSKAKNFLILILISIVLVLLWSVFVRNINTETNVGFLNTYNSKYYETKTTDITDYSYNNKPVKEYRFKDSSEIVRIYFNESQGLDSTSVSLPDSLEYDSFLNYVENNDTYYLRHSAWSTIGATTYVYPLEGLAITKNNIQIVELFFFKPTTIEEFDLKYSDFYNINSSIFEESETGH